MKIFLIDMKHNLKITLGAFAFNAVLFGVLVACYNLQKSAIIELFALLYTLPAEVLNFVGLGKRPDIASVDLFLCVFMPFFHMLSFSFVGKICRSSIYAWEEDRQQLYYFTQPVHRIKIWFQKSLAAVLNLVIYQLFSACIYLFLTYVFNVHIRRMFFGLEVMPRALRLFTGTFVVELVLLVVLLVCFTVIKYQSMAKSLVFYLLVGSFLVGWSGIIFRFVNYVVKMITGKGYGFLASCADILENAKYVSCFYWTQYCQAHGITIVGGLIVGFVVILLLCIGMFLFKRRESVSV